MTTSTVHKSVESPKRCRISLIIAALNEEDVIENTIREVVAQVEKGFADYEIILVNDGSLDATGEIMDRLASLYDKIRVLHNPTNCGLGASYKRAIGEVRFEYVMMLCGDGGLPAESLPPIFDAIGAADIVVPYMTNLRTIKTPLRYALSRSYTNLLNFLFQEKLQYYNGLPIHRLDLLRQIVINSSGFGVQGEILIKLLKAGCTYVEVGVRGAEKTSRSGAVSFRNLANVAKTLVLLIWGMLFFNPNIIKRESLRQVDALNRIERGSKDKGTSVTQ